MRHMYRIQVGDWMSKEEYSNYEANKVRVKLRDCFTHKVVAVRVR